MAFSPKGSTLIESLFAVLILGFMFLLFQSGMQALSLAQTTGHRDIALKIVRAELESLRAGGYAALPGSGSFSHASLASLPSGSGTRTISAYNTKTKQAVVSVSWTEPKTGQARSLTLTTLITEAGGL